MSRESHQRYLQQAALREAQKALAKNSAHTLSRDTFGQLLVQTVEPWKRILLAMIGLPLLGVGIFLICTNPFWAGIILSLIGTAIVVLAILGRKKTVDAALDSVDVIAVAAQLFDAF